jgi:hypothetical protein
MPRLDKKFTAEITRPTKIISYIFEMPGRTAIAATSNTHVYEYGSQ